MKQHALRRLSATAAMARMFKRCVCSILLAALVLSTVPLTAARAGRTDSLTLSVGSTCTLYATSSHSGVYSYGWYSNNIDAVEITSGVSSSVCCIKVVGASSSPVIVRCDMFYQGAYGYFGKDFYDCYITISGTGSDSSGSYTISGPSSVSVNMVNGYMSIPIECGTTFSDSVYLRFTNTSGKASGSFRYQGKTAYLDLVPGSMDGGACKIELIKEESITYLIIKDKLTIRYTTHCTHRYGEPTVVVAPTYTTEGREERRCPYCGDVSTQTIPVLTQPTSYAVSYHANGGSNAPAEQTKTHGAALTLSSASPTRSSSSAGKYTVTLNANGGSVAPGTLSAARTTSYTFRNWNTAADGSGTAYAPGASYTADAAVTLYAQWSVSTVTAPVTLPVPTRSGYAFVGWATSSSGVTGTTGSYTPDGNVTLYAVWKADAPVLTLGANSVHIPAGETVRRKFTAAQTGTYSFYTTGSSDTYGYLYNENETQLTSNDDGGNNRNFRIEYDLRAGQTVWVGVRFYSSSTSGNVTLEAAYVSAPVLTLGTNSVNIPAGETVRRKFTAAQTGTYSFYTTGSSDTYGYLYNENETQLTYNDDDGSNRNFRIEYDLRAGQTVWVGVRFYSSSTSGSVTLEAAYVSAASSNGSCGSQCLWRLTDGQLIISGSGPMSDYDVASEKELPPWHDLSFTSVRIEEGVTSVGDCAFADHTAVRSVKLPESLTQIGFRAFQGTAVGSMQFPGRLREVGLSAFEGCTELKSVSFQNGVTLIDSYAFAQCSRLSSVRLPETLTKIGYGAFSDCTALKSINIPDGVRQIEMSTFSGCTSLASVQLPETLVFIEHYAFAETALDRLVVPDCVVYIGDYAFSRTSLYEIALPENLIWLGDGVFKGCTALKKMVIPAGVRSVGSSLFEGCSSLTTVAFVGDTDIGKSLKNASAVRTLYLGHQAVVEADALSGTDITLLYTSDSRSEWNLSVGSRWSGYLSRAYIVYDTAYFSNLGRSTKSFTLPDGLTTISPYSFGWVDAEYIICPKNLKRIESCAFAGNDSLRIIEIPSTVNYIAPDAFEGCPGVILMVDDIGYAFWYALNNNLNRFVH